jgi:DMSO/TMAO reductase YedYZ heme-binding membrane subunit
MKEVVKKLAGVVGAVALTTLATKLVDAGVETVRRRLRRWKETHKKVTTGG